MVIEINGEVPYSTFGSQQTSKLFHLTKESMKHISNIDAATKTGRLISPYSKTGRLGVPTGILETPGQTRSAVRLSRPFKTGLTVTLWTCQHLFVRSSKNLRVLSLAARPTANHCRILCAIMIVTEGHARVSNPAIQFWLQCYSVSA